MRMKKVLSLLLAITLLAALFALAPAAGAEETTGTQSFVTSVFVNNQRNDFENYMGYRFTIGANDVTVTSLGRIFLAGNSQSHDLKLVDAETNADLASVSVDLSAGGTIGAFSYADLTAPVTLKAGKSYYLVSREYAGGDKLAEGDALFNTRGIGTVDGQVYYISSYNFSANPGYGFVGLDFRYQTAVSDVPVSEMVQSYSAPTLRNDVGFWIGTKLVVGNEDLVVRSVGRMFYEGNTQSHALRIVAADGTELALEYVYGGTVGKYTYAELRTPVTLQAGGTYYFLSMENYGGDKFAEGDSTAAINTKFASVIPAFQLPDQVAAKAFTDAGAESKMFVGLNLKFDEERDTASYDTVEGISVVSLGSLRNDFDNFVGIKLTVGSENLLVTALGRMFLDGNSQMHTVKFVDVETGEDVAGAKVQVLGGENGKYTYAQLAQPVTLKAGRSYYLVSREYINGDQFYEANTMITTAAGVANDGWVYTLDGSEYTETGALNYTLGLVNFQYEKKAYPDEYKEQALATGYQFTTTRNNFGSFIGMRFTVGSEPITVSQLGRIFLTGNTQTHRVKLVDAATGLDVPGAFADVTGGENGKITYAPLAEPVTLAANHSYYLVSMEFIDGDSWYDGDSTVTMSGKAACDGWVYYLPEEGKEIKDSYVFGDIPEHSFVGLNLKFFDTNNPETGNGSMGILLYTLTALSAAAMLSLIFFMRRKKQNEVL